MVVRVFTPVRQPSTEEVLLFGRGGLTFSAIFIKNNSLQNHDFVTFMIDDENDYFLGFTIHSDAEKPSLRLMKPKSGSSRKVKGAEMINSSAVMSAIQKDDDKAHRTFPIEWNKEGKFWFVLLRPSFEKFCDWENKASIPDSALGIYRYVDRDGSILYIGKGRIKDRARSPERDEWGIHKIEYSLIEANEDCLKWEAYYLSDFRRQNGELPAFNRIAGQDKG